jgi:hypothetical protein
VRLRLERDGDGDGEEKGWRGGGGAGAELAVGWGGSGAAVPPAHPTSSNLNKSPPCCGHLFSSFGFPSFSGSTRFINHPDHLLACSRDSLNVRGSTS